jgi:hypothetical protein
MQYLTASAVLKREKAAARCIIARKILGRHLRSTSRLPDFTFGWSLAPVAAILLG